MEQLGITIRMINITDACLQHFEDIGHKRDSYDVTYENTQARERTQILMDIANKEGGIVVGTGDMSELALGWCTYNGDHMSMYAVNVSVPKTLVKYLVRAYAELHPMSMIRLNLSVTQSSVQNFCRQMHRATSHSPQRQQSESTICMISFYIILSVMVSRRKRFKSLQR